MRAINRLFSPEVIEHLANVNRPAASEWDSAGVPVRERHRVLAASEGNGWWAAWRTAWADFLEAAELCGLLTDPELLGNLTGDGDEQFRGAMAECLAAWYFATYLGMEVMAKPEDKSSKNVDLLVKTQDGEFFVEVKAPHVPRISSHVAGDDTEVLVRCIKAAGRQAKKGRCNLLVVVPLLRTPLSFYRDQLLGATVGQMVWKVPVSLERGVEPPPAEVVFKQDGKLARLRPSGGSFSTDLTRIGAVLSIELRMTEDEEERRQVEPFVLAVHNPFAECPIQPESLGCERQLVVKDGHMQWTDGHRFR